MPFRAQGRIDLLVDPPPAPKPYFARVCHTSFHDVPGFPTSEQAGSVLYWTAVPGLWPTDLYDREKTLTRYTREFFSSSRCPIH